MYQKDLQSLGSIAHVTFQNLFAITLWYDYVSIRYAWDTLAYYIANWCWSLLACKNIHYERLIWGLRDSWNGDWEIANENRHIWAFPIATYK